MSSLGWAARRRPVLLVALAVGALGVTALVADLTSGNWQQRYPFVHGWSPAESVFFAAGWCSVLTGQLAGLWLWWRAPRNPTGRWLWLAGSALGVWFTGVYWPSRWGPLLANAVNVMRPALAMALLGWPTGTPSRTERRWILILFASTMATGVVTGLFAGSDGPRGWPPGALSPFTVRWVSAVFGSIAGWVFGFAPALAVVVILVRRYRTMPSAFRPVYRPVLITGAAVAGSDLATVVISTIASGLTFDDVHHHETFLGAATLAVNYSQVALAALGLLAAAYRRRRTVRAGELRQVLDIGGASPIVDPSSGLGRLIGDATAKVLYLRPGATWVNAAGRPEEPGGPHRTVTTVHDRQGTLVAAIDTDARLGLHAALIEVGAAAVATRLAHERAEALAAARRVELVGLQRSLLESTDLARRRLERDLHDGAQQRLVGLALQARLGGTPRRCRH